jgi:hypothetical protein
MINEAGKNHGSSLGWKGLRTRARMESAPTPLRSRPLSKRGRNIFIGFEILSSWLVLRGHPLWVWHGKEVKLWRKARMVLRSFEFLRARVARRDHGQIEQVCVCELVESGYVVDE